MKIKQTFKNRIFWLAPNINIFTILNDDGKPKDININTHSVNYY